MATDFKVYRNGEFVASCKHAEDAAALVGLAGGSVKWCHAKIIYPDTERHREIAANSYDEAAEIMLTNLRQYQLTAYAKTRGVAAHYPVV